MMPDKNEFTGVEAEAEKDIPVAGFTTLTYVNTDGNRMVQIVKSDKQTEIRSTKFDGGAEGKKYDGKMAPAPNPEYEAKTEPVCKADDLKCLNVDELAHVI